MATVYPLDDLKQWLDIDPSDTCCDELLQSLADAAADAVDAYTCRTMALADYDEVVNGLGGESLPLNNYPVVTVASVTLGMPNAPVPLQAERWSFDDNGLFMIGGRFPRGRRNVRVVYTAGFDPLPPSVLQALRYTAKAMWDAKGVDMNATGEDWSGIGGTTFWQTGPGEIPPQAKLLLSRYVKILVV